MENKRSDTDLGNTQIYFELSPRASNFKRPNRNELLHLHDRPLHRRAHAVGALRGDGGARLQAAGHGLPPRRGQGAGRHCADNGATRVQDALDPQAGDDAGASHRDAHVRQAGPVLLGAGGQRTRRRASVDTASSLAQNPSPWLTAWGGRTHPVSFILYPSSPRRLRRLLPLSRVSGAIRLLSATSRVGAAQIRL